MRYRGSPRLRMLFAAIGMLYFYADASADQIRVSQREENDNTIGYSSGTYNVLGYINVYNTALTMQGYYNYVSDSGHPANPPLAANISNLFFVNSAVDGLGLFMMHGKEDPLSQGTNVKMEFRYDAAAMARFLFRDDPGDGYKVNGTTITNGNVATTYGNKFETDHSWANNTDGAVIGALSNSWTLYASFQGTGNTFLDTWRTYSNDGSNSYFGLEMNDYQWVKFEYISDVPTPAGIVSASIGVVGLALYTLRRRKSAVTV